MGYRDNWEKYLEWCNENQVKPIIKGEEDPNSFIKWLKNNDESFSPQLFIDHARDSDITRQGWETRKEEEMVVTVG